jgi:hypothetical protein
VLDFIEKKVTGWYGPDDYHIVLMTDGGAPVGGMVAAIYRIKFRNPQVFYFWSAP